jgi:hypothetical protein
MDLENILEVVGPFGLYQKILCIYLCVIIAPFFAFNNLAQFLIFLVPDHKCINFNEADDVSIISFLTNVWDGYSSEPDNRQCEFIISDDNITSCVHGYVYDYSLIYPTIVSEVSFY